MKNNYQRGTIYEASGSFFVRYFANLGDGKKRVSHKLCDRDETHYSITCPAILALRDEHMVTTRRPTPQLQHHSSPNIGNTRTFPRWSKV